MTLEDAFPARGAAGEPVEETEHAILDVLIIGAGLSGIGAAYRIHEALPEVSYEIFEARDSLGGTWDLFRYPGIRSDSDMYTLAFPFEPWTHPDAIANGADILDYLKATARKYGIDDHIRYGHQVTAMDWSSDDACWHVKTSGPEGVQTTRARFVHACSGYYSYTTPYQADIPGLTDFAGDVIHPQFWPEGLDVAGKHVTIIGSGATAITLVPALAKAGAVVTMLQRTPSYVLSQPGRDPLAKVLSKALPADKVHTLLRQKNVALQWGSYQFCRKAPGVARRILDGGVRAAAGPDHRASFDAPYAPWDQRLCLVPNGDLFKVLKKGDATVVTDTIAAVEPDGIRTTGGTFLDADIIVTATGLSIELLGGASISVDGDAVKLGDRLTYRGCMLDGVPNASLCVGYINASWGLRSDLTNQFVARLLAYMDRNGAAVVVPEAPAGLERRPLLEMDSGYLRRAAQIMPRKSDAEPWTMRQNYYLEAREMKNADVTDSLRFLSESGTSGSHTGVNTGAAATS